MDRPSEAKLPPYGATGGAQKAPEGAMMLTLYEKDPCRGRHGLLGICPYAGHKYVYTISRLRAEGLAQYGVSKSEAEPLLGRRVRKRLLRVVVEADQELAKHHGRDQDLGPAAILAQASGLGGCRAGPRREGCCR